MDDPIRTAERELARQLKRAGRSPINERFFIKLKPNVETNPVIYEVMYIQYVGNNCYPWGLLRNTETNVLSESNLVGCTVVNIED